MSSEQEQAPSFDLRPALRISLTYGVAAALWILISDLLLSQILPAEQIGAYQTYKGWGFVLVTAMILYIILRRELAARARVEALRRSEEQHLLYVLNITTDAIIVTDEAQRILRFNQGAEQIFGYTAEEILGQSVEVLLPEHLRSTHDQHLLTFAASPDPSRQMDSQHEVSGRRKDGSGFPVEVSVAKFDTNGRQRFMVILRDVTRRKQVEAALRQARDELEQRVAERTAQLRQKIDEYVRIDRELRATMLRLAALIENLQAGVLFVDEAGRPVLVNQQFCDLFGIPVPPGQLVEQGIDNALESIGALLEAPAAFRGRTRRLVEARQLVTEEELTLRDGRTLEQDFIPVFQNDVYVGHLWQYRDITDRKRSEAKLQQALEEVNALYTIGRKLVTASTLEALLRAFAGPAFQAEPCNIGLLYYDLDAEGKPEWLELVARVVNIDAVGMPVGSRFRLADLRIGRQLLEDPASLFTIPDVEEQPLLDAEVLAMLRAGNIRALALVPLATRERLVGCVGFAWGKPYALSAELEKMYAFLAPQMAALVESRRLYDQVTEAERRYRLMADNATDIISRHAPDGVCLYTSPACRTLLGYEPEEILGRTAYEFCHPEDLEALRHLHAEVATSSGTATASYRARRKDGGYVWLETTSRAIRDPETGEALEILAVSRDISERKRAEQAIQEANDALERRVEARTRELRQANALLEAQIRERKEAEEALRQSEERLRVVLHNMPVMLHAQDAENRFVMWNRECERLTGYSAEEIVNNPRAWELFYPDAAYREHILAEIRERNNQYREWERRLVCKDGSVKTISWSNISRDYPIPGWAAWGIGVDVTARVQAQEALAASEAKLRQIMSQMPAVVWTTDTELRITSIMGASLAQAQRDGTSETGSTLNEILDAQDTGHPAIAAHLEALRGKVGTFTLTSDSRTFEVRVESLRDPADHIIGCVSVALDITTRVAAEAEIQRLNAELEARVIERTAQLEAANQELEAFSYSVSHDLRAPLRALDGFSRILLNDFADALPEDAQRYLGLVRTNAIQMRDLIDALLSFSRLGRQALRKQVVQPAEIVQSVLGAFEKDLEERRIDLVIGELPPCRADPVLLHQVYMNLIDNAVKFTRQCSSARIEIGFQHSGGKAVYFVRDNGVGFDIRYVGKLFGVFQRLHRAEDYEGTGVGLAIVHRIITRHGGHVWAEGAVNQGATFYFTLGEAAYEG